MDDQQFTLRKPFLWTLALLFLAGMHYLQINLGGTGLQVPFNAVSWIFISSLIGLSLWQITLNQKIYYSNFSLKFGLVVLMLCIPMLYPNNDVAIYAIPRLMGLIAGWLLFMGLIQFGFRKKHLNLILYLILTGILIESLWGLTQYYLVGVWSLIPENIIGFFPEKMRPHGIFQQPNVMASFMATGIALSFYLSNQTRWHRHFWWAKLIIFLVPVTSGLMLILNLSRTGFIAAIASLLLLIPLANRNRYHTSKKWLLLLILGIGLGLFSSQPSKLGRSVDSITQPGLRMPMYLHSLEMIKQKPLMGWGYGGFEKQFLSSSKQAGDSHQPINFGNMDHPHNELLYWTIEGGIIPLLALLYAAWLLIGLLKQPSKYKGLAYLAILLPILLHSMTEYPFYHAIIHWAVFILLLSLLNLRLDSSNNNTRSVNWRPTFLLRALALFIPIFTGLFMITTLRTNYLIGKFEVINQFQNPKPLQDIINPVAFGLRIDWDIFSYRFRHGQQMGEQGQPHLAAFSLWAEQAVKHSPRDQIYQNWILSLRLLQQDKKAKEVIAEAQRLYPHSKRITQAINQQLRK